MGMTEIAPDSAIKPAATILMLRDDPSFEVLMVKRHHQIDFASKEIRSIRSSR